MTADRYVLLIALVSGGCSEPTKLGPAEVASATNLRCRCGIADIADPQKNPFVCDVPKANNIGLRLDVLDQNGNCVLHTVTRDDVDAAERFEATGGAEGRLLCGTDLCPVSDERGQIIARNIVPDSRDRKRYQDAVKGCLDLNNGTLCVAALNGLVVSPSAASPTTFEQYCEELCRSRSSRVTYRECDSLTFDCSFDPSDLLTTQVECGALVEAVGEPAGRTCTFTGQQPDPPPLVAQVDTVASEGVVFVGGDIPDAFSCAGRDPEDCAEVEISGSVVVNRDHCQTFFCPFSILEMALDVSAFTIRGDRSTENAIGRQSDIPGFLFGGGALLLGAINGPTVLARGRLDSDGVTRQGDFAISPLIHGHIDDAQGEMTFDLLVGSTDVGLGGKLRLVSRFLHRAPRASFTSPPRVECGGELGGGVAVDASLSADPDGDISDFVWFVDGSFAGFGNVTTLRVPLGQHRVLLQVRDRTFLTDEAEGDVLVEDASPIRIDCPPPVVVECEAPEGAVVDPGDALVSDPCMGIVSLTDPGPTRFALGTTPVEYTVVDGGGRSASCETSVTVRDTAPPRLVDFGFSGPMCLWPPNHKSVVLDVGNSFSAIILDACDPHPELVVVGVESDQADDAISDGSTVGDASFTSDVVCLRSERQGQDVEGRTYSISLAAQDASGNRSDPRVEVRVPHDQRDRDCPRLPVGEFVSEDDPRCAADANAITGGAPPSEEGPRTTENVHFGCSAAARGEQATGFTWALVLMLLLLLARRAVRKRGSCNEDRRGRS